MTAALNFTVRDGKLQFTVYLGNGREMKIETVGRWNDGQEHTVVLYKEEFKATMQVDQRPVIEAEIADKVTLDVKGEPLFIGEYRNVLTVRCYGISTFEFRRLHKILLQNRSFQVVPIPTWEERQAEDTTKGTLDALTNWPSTSSSPPASPTAWTLTSPRTPTLRRRSGSRVAKCAESNRMQNCDE